MVITKLFRIKQDLVLLLKMLIRTLFKINFNNQLLINKCNNKLFKISKHLSWLNRIFSSNQFRVYNKCRINFKVNNKVVKVINNKILLKIFRIM